MKPTVSDRIRRRPALQPHLAHGRIERDEDLVLRRDRGSGQPVEERRFARVGVADDRHERIKARAGAPPDAARGCG